MVAWGTWTFLWICFITSNWHCLIENYESQPGPGVSMTFWHRLSLPQQSLLLQSLSCCASPQGIGPGYLQGPAGQHSLGAALSSPPAPQTSPEGLPSKAWVRRGAGSWAGAHRGGTQGVTPSSLKDPREKLVRRKAKGARGEWTAQKRGFKQGQMSLTAKEQSWADRGSAAGVHQDGHSTHPGHTCTAHPAGPSGSLGQGTAAENTPHPRGDTHQDFTPQANVLY